MVFVAAKFIQRDPSVYCYNPIITIQGRIYHRKGTVLEPERIYLTFLSIEYHDADFAEHSSANFKKYEIPLLEHEIIAHAENSQQHNSSFQNFMILCEWLFGERDTRDDLKVIHTDKTRAAKHVKSYNGPSAFDIAANVLRTEDDEVNKWDIIFLCRAALWNSGYEALHCIPICNKSYDPLSYVFSVRIDGWNF